MRKNAIHNISNTDGISEYYTLNGNHDFLDEDGFPRVNNHNSDKVYAKCLRNKLTKTFGANSQFRFYICVNASNKPFNPISNETIPEPNKFVNKVCKGGSKFIEVNQAVFQKYLEFLKTKNTRWLVDLEREVI
jgi:hypothetical protein